MSGYVVGTLRQPVRLVNWTSTGGEADTLVTTTEGAPVNPIARMRRALLRAADVLPERLVIGWASDVVTGPLSPNEHSESACHPREACPTGLHWPRSPMSVELGPCTVKGCQWGCDGRC